VVFIYVEATEELSLDNPQTQEAADVDHQKDGVSGRLPDRVDNHSHDSSYNEPPQLNIVESAVSSPFPKSQSEPQVNPTVKQRSGAKVNTTFLVIFIFLL